MNDDDLNGLRASVSECAQRGLFAASKWSSELLLALPHPHPDDTEAYTATQIVDTSTRHPLAPPLAPLSASERAEQQELEEIEDDALFAARTYLASREPMRAIHVVRHCRSAKALFISTYSHFLQATESRERNKLDNTRHQPPVPVTATVETLLQGVANVTDPWMLYLKALLLSRVPRRRDEAIESAILSIAAFPWNWATWALLSSCVQDGGELSALLPLLPLPATHPLVQMFQIKTMNELQAPSDHELDLCDQLLAPNLFPGSLWLMGLRARTLYHTHDFRQAQAQFEEILSIDPNRVEDIDVFSDILYVTDERLKLSKVANDFLILDRERPEVCCLVGNLYSQRAEHEKAIKYFRRATQLDRTYLSAWTLMGHEYVEMKNSHAAIESYRRAVDVNRKDYRAWYGLGQAYELLNMHQYALHYYHNATALRPYDVRLWQAQGMCYEEMGRLKEAIECFKRALITADPNEISITLRLANLHGALGDAYAEYAFHRRVVEVCLANNRLIYDYSKSSVRVAEYCLQTGEELLLARDYMKIVAASNSEEVVRAAELLKLIETALAKASSNMDEESKSTFRMASNSLSSSSSYHRPAAVYASVLPSSTSYSLPLHPPSSTATWKPPPNWSLYASQKIFRQAPRAPEDAEQTKAVAARVSARLEQDHAAVLHPDTETPFADAYDATRRLLPYHVFCHPKEDLVKDRKGKRKADDDEVAETKFALDCFRRKRKLEQRFRGARLTPAKRPAPEELLLNMEQLVYDETRQEVGSLQAELKLLRADLDRLQRAKQAQLHPPVQPTTTYYQSAYPTTYNQQQFGQAVPTPAPSAGVPGVPGTLVPVNLNAAMLPTLHALGIRPIEVGSIPPGAPQPPAILRSRSQDGTMLNLEIDHRILQTIMMLQQHAANRTVGSGSGKYHATIRAPSPDRLETTSLQQPENGNSRSYGTVPTRRGWKVPPISLPASGLPSPSASARVRSPSISGFRELAYSRLSAGQRPISSYDPPTSDKFPDENDARVNGVRVWYSSFSSIDWLHDAIKDSLRFSRLRKRKSWRARARLILDKSMGWLIVTLVGFLTACVAFLVIRGEAWFFDLKEGYCTTSFWKSRRFCCLEQTECSAWRTWSEILLRKGAFGEGLLEFVPYTVIAIALASASCFLTLYLTNSTTFITRKESGVLAPDFADNPELPGREKPTRKVMYYAAGSGIPEIKTILSGFVIHGYLGGRTLFTKAERKAPFVHIASCIGNICSRFTTKYENNEAKRREIISAACAAGVAVAFGAPIGGTLFSLEEVSYYFPPKVMWRSFFCAMIAALTLRILDPFGTGKLVLFQVTYDKDWHAFELLPFLLLGVFGGVYGAYFSKLNFRWSRDVRNKTWLKTHPAAEVMLITLLTSILCFLNPFTRMGGPELVFELFSECKPGATNHTGLCIIDPGSFDAVWPVVQAILVAMVVKAGLTVITFGIKVPAGIFIPSLAVGACAGRVMGILMQSLQARHPDLRLFQTCGGDMNCIIPGLYAMVGAAASLSGVTRTTISLAVITFELTDSLTYTVPLMLVILVSKTLADALEPKGIYDLVIDLSNLPYLDAKHEYLWGSLQVNDVMVRDGEVIRLDYTNTVRSLIEQLQKLLAAGNDDSGFPIVRKDGNEDNLRMVGYIGANELEHALSLIADDPEDEVHFHPEHSHRGGYASASFSSLLESGDRDMDPFDLSLYMDQAPLTVQSNSPLEMVQLFFTKLGARYVVVTDGDGFYEGVITKKTWLHFLTTLEEK
ncbi:Chloride channel protein [Mycena kentingensis (nom. inval.)]|nr:Chloride channel protein [Mycena kentingensis (nom. inval.)]